MTNEKTQWYEKYTNKTYKGVRYTIYGCTPTEAEDKAKRFIDSLYDGDIPKLNISIIFEGSKTVIVDTWIYHSCVCEFDIKHDRYLITRQKDQNGKYGYRIRYVL